MNEKVFRVLSANTLFHFTPSLDNLVSILTNEFCPKYCLEDLNVAVQTNEARKEGLEVALPMVSFCDIPLSQTAYHLTIYGDYGIGMSKSWGKQNRIAPILYTYPGSLTTTRLAMLMDEIMKNAENKSVRDQLWERFFDFASFIKPYEGNLWRRSGQVDNVRFYDEREWRFVPTVSAPHRKVLGKEEFLDEASRSAANQELANSCRISFEPNDIKYLIVRLEEEIVPFIREVERIKGKYGYDEVKLVTSRVISAEQIRSDF